MDIIVTIPKDRMAQVEKEETLVKALLKRGIPVNFFWSLGRRPKNLEVGDRCYFVWDGAMRAWHEVIGFGSDIWCETTCAFHSGFCVILAPEIHAVVELIPMKGFRGFRYRKEDT